MGWDILENPSQTSLGEQYELRLSKRVVDICAFEYKRKVNNLQEEREELYKYI